MLINTLMNEVKYLGLLTSQSDLEKPLGLGQQLKHFDWTMVDGTYFKLLPGDVGFPSPFS